MDKKIENTILKILRESTDFEDFKNKINSFNTDKEQNDLNLFEMRRKAKDKKEYQKLTYQINKNNKPQIINLNIYGNECECISSKTFYINLLKYSKVPAEEFLIFFKAEIVFLSENSDCDYCTLDSVVNLLHKSCSYFYSKKQLNEMLNNNNFNIFITPADVLRSLNLSSTKSLNIRIKKFNEMNEHKIVPFEFQIKNKTKILYLQNDLKLLKKSLF